jgi:sulfite reductase beta subunit-like hemoprotein
LRRRNSVEALKASKCWNPLRIRDDVPGMIANGWENLSQAEKDLLKWVGVFFRKPTPGKFMMRIRMPNGFATSEQLRTIAELSRRIGNGVLDITTRQQIELRGFTLDTVPEIWEKLLGVDLHSIQTGMDNVRNINGCALATSKSADEGSDGYPRGARPERRSGRLLERAGRTALDRSARDAGCRSRSRLGSLVRPCPSCGGRARDRCRLRLRCDDV